MAQGAAAVSPSLVVGVNRDVDDFIAPRAPALDASGNPIKRPKQYYFSPKTLQTANDVLLMATEDGVVNERMVLSRFVHAIVRNEKDVFEQLLPFLNVNIRGNFGWTPLFETVHRGKYILMCRLLESGADVTIPTKKGRTVLHVVGEEHKSRRMLTTLLDNSEKYSWEKRQAFLNAQDEEGQTALFIVCSKGNMFGLELLLRHGADPTICTRKGASPLWIACRAGHLDVVKRLLAEKVPLDAPDQRGFTPFMMAVLREHMELINFLLELEPKPDINAVTWDYGMTPVQLAMTRGSQKTIQVLLEQNPKPHLWNLAFRGTKSILEIRCPKKSLRRWLRHEIWDQIKEGIETSPYALEMKCPQVIVQIFCSYAY